MPFILIHFRQLSVYEIEFSVLQEEQTNIKCQTDQLKCDIESKERDLEAARAEIVSLKQRLHQTEAMVRQLDNNNKPTKHQSSCEDVLFKVVAAVEALSTQVPEDIGLVRIFLTLILIHHQIEHICICLLYFQT